MQYKDHTFVICAYKKSKYLEMCIKSVLRQTVQSGVIICTSTPNDYITKMAEKYNLELKIRNGISNIRDDWNFAMACADTSFVTIAHQDDIYHSKYVECMLEAFHKRTDATIFFSGYRPIKNGEVSMDINCIIRAMLRMPMRLQCLSKNKFFKNIIFSFGNSVCCPTVTYSKKILGDNLFTSTYQYNIDWDTFRKIANTKGSFAYDPRALVGYRIHDGATSKCFIDNTKRYYEDERMFEEIWGKQIAHYIMKIYTKAYNTYTH